jgi:hypothetical protein
MCRLDLAGSECGQVKGFCEHANEPSVSEKSKDF